jgi:hypothetical protein
VHGRKSQNITQAYEELHDLYSQLSLESNDQWASHITNRRVKINTYEILEGEPEHNWTIEHEGADETIILTLILIRGMALFDSNRYEWRAFMNTVKNIWVTQNAGNLLTR